MNKKLGLNIVDKQMKDYLDSKRLSRLKKVKDKSSEVIFPMALDHKQEHYLTIINKGSCPQGDLENRSYQEKKGKEIYNFLVAWCPAGIFRAFIHQIILGDVGCNNYFGKHIGLKNREVVSMAAKEGMKMK